MTTGQSSGAPRDIDDAIVDSLVDQHGISSDAVATIRRIMETEGVKWSVAAAMSGMLTPDQIEDVIMWAEQRRTVISTDGIIERALRRPKGGQLVRSTSGIEVRPGPQVLFAHDPYSPRSEKIRSLRTELMLLSDSATMILAIIGSGPSEGRSALAAELAIAFGQLGRRTLLVDADLRSPSQHILFQTDNDFGLAETIAAGHAGVMRDVVGLPAMSLLTAGNAATNPMELLSDRQFDRLTESWRRQFEVVILDTPPVSQFSDGLAVATLAGRALIVSRSVTTSYKDMKEMLRRLALTRSQILGAVINHF
jgi:protein-tyrosine kinase